MNRFLTTAGLFGLACCLGMVLSVAGPHVRAADEPAAEKPAAGHAAEGHEASEHGSTEPGTSSHGDGAGHGGGHGNTNPLSVDPDLAIFTLVIFLVLMGVLWKFAWGPISEGLDRRESTIAEQIAAAERANTEAKRIMADYERKIAQAQDEVRGIMEEARRDAEHTQQEILAQARVDAQAERDRALREIGTATDQALKMLAENSANLAVELAGKVVQAQLKKSDHERLVNEAVAQFLKSGGSKN